MNGHWLSQTRKLNKHYQSGNRVTPVPLWGEIQVLNCGGCVSQTGFNYGLYFDNQGIWITTHNDVKGELYLPNVSIRNLQGNILPLMYIMYGDITFNGYPFPDLHNVNFVDSTGKLKFKYDTVTLRYDNGTDVFTETTDVILVYVNISDVPMYSQYVTDIVQYMNAHWELPYRLPKTAPLTVGVNRPISVFDSYGSLSGDGVITYEKTFAVNANDELEYEPPAVGSGVSFNNSIVDPYFMNDVFFGQYGLRYVADASLGLIYRTGITNADGYVSGNTPFAQYDNFVVGNSVYGINPNTFHLVEITDNNGLFFDQIAVYEQNIDCGYNTQGTFNGSHVTGWN